MRIHKERNEQRIRMRTTVLRIIKCERSGNIMTQVTYDTSAWQTV